MTDRLFSVVLLLNLTGLFRFLAPRLGGEVATVSILLLLVNLAYLGLRLPILIRLLHRRLVVAWVVVLGVWPILTVLYAPQMDVRWAGLQAYYTSLFLGAAVFAYRQKWSSMRELTGFAFLVSLVGLGMSWAAPHAFEPVADIAGARIDYHGRAGGFFMQPNIAGACITFMFIAWSAGSRVRSSAVTGAMVLLMLVVVAATGSRGSLLVALLLGAMVLWGRLIHDSPTGRLRFSRGVRTLKIAGVAAVLVIAIAAGVQAVESTNSTAEAYVMLANRLELFTGLSAEGVQEDRSVAVRLLAQTQYLGMIGARPLFGYGLGSAMHFQVSGELIKSSHNVFIESAFECGIPYLLAVLCMLGVMIRHPNRRIAEVRFGSTALIQLVAALILVGLMSNTLLATRPVIVILGALTTCLLFPERIDRRVRRFVLTDRRPEPAGVALHQA